MSAKEAVGESIAAQMRRLQIISNQMYENPEVAFEEHATAVILTDYLEEHGFAVERHAYGLETAFVARAGTDGPEVVICAEMDALPGVGHACGHNIIATAALGAGVALAPLADKLGIRVTVLGTPAEENFGGKVDLINAGAFTGAVAAMMVHPSPHDIVDPNVIAVAHWNVEFHGKSAHASAYPDKGINALDAAVQSYVNISTLRQSILPTDKIHGIIVSGGDAANIIPHYTKSSWYVRAQTMERLAVVSEKVRACFEAAATATGCRLEIEPMGHTYTELVNNPVMVDIYAANSAALGRPMLRGTDFPPSQTGSTDMGNVSLVVPSIHPMLGIDPGEAVNHQPEFAAATVQPAGVKAIHDGAVGMAWTVVDLAEQDLWDQLDGPADSPRM
ncbi:MAG: M20 family metallopeptidase [Acidimicrobiia bacterium]